MRGPHAGVVLSLALTGCVPQAEGPPPWEPPCGAADLAHAPPPIDSALGTVAAIDLQRVRATVTVTEAGVAIDAEATFLTGPHDARPAFELGPVPDTVLLDDAPATLDRTEVSDPSRPVVVLQPLEACTPHTLRVSYTLDPDWMASPGEAFRMDPQPDGLFFAAGLEDNAPGRFMSMWVPSNLLFDRFDLELELVDALASPHELVSTGTMAETDTGWTLSWTAVLPHTPFWVLSPTALTERRTATARTAAGDVTIEVRALTTDASADVDEAAARAVEAMETFSERFAPYPHGDRYILWIRDDGASSMEYDGATLTEMGAIEHEIFHSWYGRGAAPLADLHAWSDEAVTSWVTDLFPYRAVPLDWSGDPVLLRIGTDEWAAPSLDLSQYVLGSSIFADIADRHGTDALVEALGAFVADWAGRSYRSSDLEEHLTCWFDDDEVRAAFRYRAYGLAGPVAPRPVYWCR